MSDKKIEFLPFHAINEFMRNDFRLAVVRATLNGLANLPEDHRTGLDRLTRKYVSVPGFRNSDRAPNVVKVLPMTKAFEKSPELVAAILAAWADLHAELRQQMFDLLTERGWKMLAAEEGNLPSLGDLKAWGVLPLSANRARMPGFYTHWPKGQDYEALYSAFSAKHPESTASLDEVSLMAVWVSLRLPVSVEEDENEDEAESPA